MATRKLGADQGLTYSAIAALAGGYTRPAVAKWARKLGLKPEVRLPNGRLRWSAEAAATILAAIRASRARRFPNEAGDAR